MSNDDTVPARERQLVHDVRELVSRYGPGIERLTLAMMLLVVVAHDAELNGVGGASVIDGVASIARARCENKKRQAEA